MALMSTVGHRERLLKFLMADNGGGLTAEQVKQFSKEVRDAGILDLSTSKHQEWVMTDDNGRVVLTTLVTYFILGLLNKYAYLKKLTKDI